MRQTKQWYDEKISSEEDVLIYYTGIYKQRNDFIFNMIKKEVNLTGKNILDLAAGSPYLAELFCKEPIGRYCMNDFCDIVRKVAVKRISSPMFSTDSFDLENIKHIIDYDIVICVSLEHIENDIQLISGIEKGTKVLLCSPDFDASGHIRFFKNVNEFKKRYENLIEIKETHTITHILKSYKGVKDKPFNKFILWGTKK
jgi:hypothetical protein